MWPQKCVPPNPKPATFASDVYSAGLMLFDLCFPGHAARPTEQQPRFNPATLPQEQKELVGLLCAMLQVDPSKRPSASMVLAHAYFTHADLQYQKEMEDMEAVLIEQVNHMEQVQDSMTEQVEEMKAKEEQRLGPAVECSVCLCDGFRQHRDGVMCPQGKHFLCNDCFSTKVSSDCAVDNMAGIDKRQAHIYCVGHTMQDDPCFEGKQPFTDDTIAKHVVDNKIFQQYLGARRKLMERKMEQEKQQAIKQRVEEELKALMAMDEEQRQVRAARMHIVENILTLKCPNPNGCGQAFVDFTGCFALTCSRCGCGFCGWCIAYCDRDAHPHVRTCPHKLNPDPYFGSVAEFEQSNTTRRRRLLQQYLPTLPAGIRAKVLQLMAGDLCDVGLGNVR